jgi:hypothetical protein
LLLSGWKDISSHLHCSTRTAQRWQVLGLPVHRPRRNNGTRGIVTAFSEEVDAWLRRFPGGNPDSPAHSLAAGRSPDLLERARRVKECFRLSVEESRRMREQSRILREHLRAGVSAFCAGLNHSMVEMQHLATRPDGPANFARVDVPALSLHTIRNSVL